ncbi:hypothetical protein Stsp02_69240 [Streptomyces sp. NBRC 14336]|nr:hypothetical protein Stsp02_69240 [Streptomyces sp. NBRC 14336]
MSAGLVLDQTVPVAGPLPVRQLGNGDALSSGTSTDEHLPVRGVDDCGAVSGEGEAVAVAFSYGDSREPAHEQGGTTEHADKGSDTSPGHT